MTKYSDWLKSHGLLLGLRGDEYCFVSQGNDVFFFYEAHVDKTVEGVLGRLAAQISDDFSAYTFLRVSIGRAAVDDLIRIYEGAVE